MVDLEEYGEYLEDIRHVLVTCDGLYCTDRPDLINNNKDLLFRLDFGEEIGLLDGLLKLIELSDAEVQNVKNEDFK